MTSATRVDALYPIGKTRIREVGLRDGLQLVSTFPTTAQKQALVDAEYGAGIRHFEVGSYVPADKFPQFADVDTIVAKVSNLPGAFSSTVVLNKKGAMRALEGRCDEIVFVVSASEAHNLRNARRSIGQTIAEIAEMAALMRTGEDAPVITVGIAMAFGCSIAGKDAVSVRQVISIAEQCLEAGADALSIADTVGYAGPVEVRMMMRALTGIVGIRPVGMHLHDTRGMAIANAAAALDSGVRMLDASLGGLGGCPFAPNASGNAVMEDLIFLAQSMGVDVPVEIDGLLAARALLQAAMPDEPLYGQLARAGLPLLSAEAAPVRSASDVF